MDHILWETPRYIYLFIKMEVGRVFRAIKSKTYIMSSVPSGGLKVRLELIFFVLRNGYDIPCTVLLTIVTHTTLMGFQQTRMVKRKNQATNTAYLLRLVVPAKERMTNKNIIMRNTLKKLKLKKK